MWVPPGIPVLEMSSNSSSSHGSKAKASQPSAEQGVIEHQFPYGDTSSGFSPS